jgi:hypothetical protein
MCAEAAWILSRARLTKQAGVAQVGLCYSCWFFFHDYLVEERRERLKLGVNDALARITLPGMKDPGEGSEVSEGAPSRPTPMAFLEVLWLHLLSEIVILHGLPRKCSLASACRVGWQRSWALATPELPCGAAVTAAEGPQDEDGRSEMTNGKM